MGSVVIHDQMYIESLRDTGVHMAQKVEELLVTMTAFALTQDCSGDGVEGCEQCGGAVSNVVVRDPFDVAEPQGQDRLAALQRLNLAFLIHTQDQGFIKLRACSFVLLLADVPLKGDCSPYVMVVT